MSYDPAGHKTGEVAHDGSVTFYAYNAAGLETERATFPLAYQSAGTRPALNFATSFISTMWDSTSNLPFRIAEPGRSTTYHYTNTVLTLKSKAPAAVLSGFSRPYPATSTRAITQ